MVVNKSNAIIWWQQYCAVLLTCYEVLITIISRSDVCKLLYAASAAICNSKARFFVLSSFHICTGNCLKLLFIFQVACHIIVAKIYFVHAKPVSACHNIAYNNNHFCPCKAIS